MEPVLSKVELCSLPTPCHRLPRLSKELGVDLWIKRDDLTGFAMGGNKGRKLEFLMAQALEMGATAVVTCGGAQSNFVRQLAGACSVLGIRCHAAIMNLPYSAIHGKPESHRHPEGRTGNLLLDDLLGAHLTLFPDDDWEILYGFAEDIAKALEAHGDTVYRIPVGGSSPVGAYAFVKAAEELERDFDYVVCPSSSGSTHAGLTHAFHGSTTKVIGVACDPEPEILDDLELLVEGLDSYAGVKGLDRSNIDFRLDWAGEAYGIPSPEGKSALEELARKEGIFLDPIYTAKAFSGLLAMIRSGEISGKICFWHTGGLPALFA